MRPLVERAGVVADGMEQVRLSQPRSAVDEQRVVGTSGLFGDRNGRRVCETVAGADDEGVEDVLVIESAVTRAGVGETPFPDARLPRRARAGRHRSRLRR